MKVKTFYIQGKILIQQPWDNFLSHPFFSFDESSVSHFRHKLVFSTLTHLVGPIFLKYDQFQQKCLKSYKNISYSRISLQLGRFRLFESFWKIFYFEEMESTKKPIRVSTSYLPSDPSKPPRIVRYIADSPLMLVL